MILIPRGRLLMYDTSHDGKANSPSASDMMQTESDVGIIQGRVYLQ